MSSCSVMDSPELPLSLCVPTNGVSEWMLPVLESIYSQQVDDSLFEVIITDNGNNDSFRESIQPFLDGHSNIHYTKTDAFEFLNQIEAFRLAKGQLIKFVNHRTLMREGSISFLLDFVEKYRSDKPFVYFSEGVLPKRGETIECANFDQFVGRLGVYSTWSTGIAMWRSDFLAIPKDLVYNAYFPHTSMLFSKRKANRYLLVNHPLLEEIRTDHSRKGKYRLFYDFAVEHQSIITQLYRDGDISLKTLRKIINEDDLEFVSTLYYRFVIRKEKCSYDLSDAKDYLSVYYSMSMVRRRILKYEFRRFCHGVTYIVTFKFMRKKR